MWHVHGELSPHCIPSPSPFDLWWPLTQTWATTLLERNPEYAPRKLLTLTARGFQAVSWQL